VSKVPNYLDLLVAFDDHIRDSNLAYVIYGTDLFGIAQAAGLTGPLDQVVVQWVGKLVDDGHMVHGPLGGGDPRPLPAGRFWTQHELSRVSDYAITYTGRTEADRVRRQRREAVTDEVMGVVFPALRGLDVPEAQRRAIEVPLVGLRAALDSERYEGAIGAAKELVEAACKLVLARAAVEPSARASVGSLAKQALAATSDGPENEDLARRMSGVVEALGDLRTEVGTGHGRAEQQAANAEVARLAASVACGIARFVLVRSA
jgi:hypothetical protein